ncbi:MAG: hypothetical protein V1792_29390 [Pseudomonadota bacterium]
MSKCSICGKRKGKRKCAQTSGMVCSPCCGQTRTEDCMGCRYFRDSKDLRRYDRVPRFSVSEMEESVELSRYSTCIEGTLAVWDVGHGSCLNDGAALTVLEMLLDKYHFGDSDVVTTDEILMEGFERVVAAIEEDLDDVPNEDLVKVLGVIYFVADRRTRGRREYFEVIHECVGYRMENGVHIGPY